MQKLLISVSSALLYCILQSSAAHADQFSSAGATGDFGRTSNLTTSQSNSPGTTLMTNTQTAVNNPTQTTQLGGIFGGVTRNGLPETSMDSFVYQAGGSAELIYGDEGTDDIPPYFEFDKSHRIERGITGLRDQALTTGHSEYLPDAWGGDEWVKGPEWDTSGNGSDYVPPYGGGLNFGQGAMVPMVDNLITNNLPTSVTEPLDEAAGAVEGAVQGALDNLPEPPPGVSISINAGF
jgi:hypothetical protein